MALTSPGVQVSVTDQSFYTPAEPGTVPVVFVASSENKANASGAGIAQGTLAANVGKPYLLTSQRDLVETFGDPVFQVDSNNNPINGSELNEYGLQAAYSLLGVSNRCYVVRAGIDLTKLVASSTAPSNTPAPGTYWLDTNATAFGIQEWNNSPVTVTNGQSFTTKTPIVITSTAQLQNGDAENAPLESIGQIGDYAVVATTTVVKIYYRNNSGNWVLVGSDEWRDSWPTITGDNANPAVTAGSSFQVENTLITFSATNLTVTEIVAEINAVLPTGYRAGAVSNRIAIYSDGTASGPDSTLTGTVTIAAGQGGDTSALTALGIDAGTYYPPALQISKHTAVPQFKLTDAENRPTGSVWIKTTSPNAGARWRVKAWNDETNLWETLEAPIYSSNAEALNALDRVGNGSNLAIGDIYITSNVAADTLPLATFTIQRRDAVGPTIARTQEITTSVPTGTYNVFIQSTEPGSDAFSAQLAGDVEIVIAGDATADAIAIASAITNAGVPNVSAEVDTQNRVLIKHTNGGDIKFTNGATDTLTDVFGFVPYGSASTTTANVYYQAGTDGSSPTLAYQGSNWKPLSYTPSNDEPTSLTEDGALWYSSIIDEVDIMVHNGNSWVGYQHVTSPFYNVAAGEKTDPAGPIVSAQKPTKQSDGTALVEGDLWIDTADLENYPTLYRYKKVLDRWELVDSSDQTTENGIIFADARYNTTGNNSDTAGDIADLLESDYLDPDAPDPALYPRGMLLWNLRRSGFNVKKFVRDYLNPNDKNGRYNDEPMNTPGSEYYPHRWVTESGNQADGSGSFGRKAQRKVVLQSMQSVINDNDEIRDDESRIFNLISAPGYPELIGEMISLNYDRGLTGFVVGDTPARLLPNATSLNEWASNVNVASEDGDLGLVSSDDYLGVFYPWGFTSDNFGNNVVVPPSHMMLRTIALSDQVSYPWFAPAGTRRGGVTNATATGYINSEGEFVSVALNEGQRDTLYSNSVNPITFITGAGLVNFGQKTRARGTSSLDRINIARLVIYLRNQLNRLAKPYIFEPNDKITRDEIKQQTESLLLELVGQRALYDFIVVCDESNNTPARIDRNELYLDIAIEPVKAIEFIYIPLRLKNTGEIAEL
jgi:hypothetical protein